MDFGLTIGSWLRKTFAIARQPDRRERPEAKPAPTHPPTCPSAQVGKGSVVAARTRLAPEAGELRRFFP